MTPDDDEPGSQPQKHRRPDRWKLLGLARVQMFMGNELAVIDTCAHALSKPDSFEDPVEAVLASVQTDLDTLATLSGESAHVPSVLGDTLDGLSRRVRAAILLLRKADELAGRPGLR